MNQTTTARETPEPTVYVIMADKAYDFSFRSRFIGGGYDLRAAQETASYYSNVGAKVYRLIPVVDAKETPRQHESTCVYYELGSCNCGAI